MNGCTAASELLVKTPEAVGVVADKGYDSQAVRDQVVKQGGKPVIPERKNSVAGNGEIDWYLYKHRHWVENAFSRLKHYRGIAPALISLGATLEAQWR